MVEAPAASFPFIQFFCTSVHFSGSSSLNRVWIYFKALRSLKYSPHIFLGRLAFTFPLLHLKRLANNVGPERQLESTTH